LRHIGPPMLPTPMNPIFILLPPDPAGRSGHPDSMTDVGA
jgi:hypothetical protein